MTRRELSQIYYLTHDLYRAEMILKELRESVQAKSQQITGMPFANTGEVSDPTANFAEKIIYYEEVVEGYKQALVIRKAAITEWINQLDDPLLRTIIHYRCIELLPWEVVAIRIGAGITEDAVKKHFYRNVPIY